MRALAPSRVVAAPRRARKSRCRSTPRPDVAAPLQRVVEYAEDESSWELHRGVPSEIQRDIDALIASALVDGGIDNAVRGDGDWRVFAAPHIVRLATPLGVLFHPLRYVIRDGTISSDVRHRGRFVPDGWLSASGTVQAVESRVCEGMVRPACRIGFDTFWIGAGASADEPRAGPGSGVVDKAINAVGKLGFVDAIATFPVLFYDERAGVVIFQFPPLKSNIAAFRRRG